MLSLALLNHCSRSQVISFKRCYIYLGCWNSNSCICFSIMTISFIPLSIWYSRRIYSVYKAWSLTNKRMFCSFLTVCFCWNYRLKMRRRKPDLKELLSTWWTSRPEFIYEHEKPQNTGLICWPVWNGYWCDEGGHPFRNLQGSEGGVTQLWTTNGMGFNMPIEDFLSKFGKH